MPVSSGTSARGTAGRASTAGTCCLASCTATGFSPTDISAIKRWAKLLMTVEAIVSLGIFGPVIARAVNILR